MTRQTHTVTGGFIGRDNKPRVTVRGHPVPLLADEAFPEGAAVIVQGNRAVRAK